MPVSIVCPNCKSKIKAPDAAIGKTVKCPKCAAPIHVGAIMPDLPVAAPYIPPAASPEVVHVDVGQAEPTTQCPFCGETVKVNARKCKHCGETIDVTHRAAEEARREAIEARKAADRAANRPQSPMVFMNAGGGASSASSSSAAAAASGGRSRRRRPFFVTCSGCFLLVLLVSCGLGIFGSYMGSQMAAEGKKALASADQSWDAGKKADAVSAYITNYAFADDKAKIIKRIADYEAGAENNAAEARKWIEKGLDDRLNVVYDTPAAQAIYAQVKKERDDKAAQEKAEAETRAAKNKEDADAKAKEEKAASAVRDQKAEEEYDSNGLVLLQKTVRAEVGDFSTEIMGTVVNRRASKLGYAQITFNVYDNSGAQVGTALANINGLEPGGRWNFKAVALVKNGVKYKVSELSGF